MEIWTKHTTLLRRHKTFSVEIVHRKDEPGMLFAGDQGNRWFIYVYLYPKHPLFEGNSRSDEYSSETGINFHCGCTYKDRIFENNGNIKCVKLGCDYVHYGDDFYSEIDVTDTHNFVKSDAEEIFKTLKEMEETINE